MLRRPHVTSIGSIVYDVFLTTPEGIVVKHGSDPTRQQFLAFERSAKIPSTSGSTSFGGGAMNSAVTFSRLGLRASVMSTIGADLFGRASLEHLREEFIRTNLIDIEKQEQTGFSCNVYHEPGADHVIFVHRGAYSHFELTERQCRRIPHGWVYLTALQRNWKPSQTQLAKVVSRGNHSLVWNPGAGQLTQGRRGLSPLLKHTHTLMVNVDEAIELIVRSGVHSKHDPRSLAKTLASWGPRFALVTNGRKGAFLSDGKTVIHQPAIVSRTVNKTGAGDAFGSGYTAGMLLFKDLRKALLLGAHNSHAVVQHLGAHVGSLRRRQLRGIHII